jgi:hypothetical protein
LKIVYLNGSPKEKASMSANILSAMERRLTGAESIRIDGSEARIPFCDALVMAFPLYVDGIPSHLLRLLEALEHASHRSVNQAARPAKLYFIINCGFMEPENAEIAIDMIGLWRQKSGLSPGQAVVFGGGSMRPSLKIGLGPSRNYKRALDALAENIKNRSAGAPILTSVNVSRFLYIKAAHRGFRAAAGKRGLKIDDLYGRL